MDREQQPIILNKPIYNKWLGGEGRHNFDIFTVPLLKTAYSATTKSN